MPQRSATEDEIINIFSAAFEKQAFSHLAKPVTQYNRNEEAFVWRHPSGSQIEIIVSVYDDFRDPDITLLIKAAFIPRNEKINVKFHSIENCSLSRPFRFEDLKDVELKLQLIFNRLVNMRANEIQSFIEQHPQIH